MGHIEEQSVNKVDHRKIRSVDMRHKICQNRLIDLPKNMNKYYLYTINMSTYNDFLISSD